MAIKTYTRAFERYPIDTLRYAASTNYYIACAATMPDYGAFVDLKWNIFNDLVIVTTLYNTSTAAAALVPTFTTTAASSGTFTDTGSMMSLTVNGSSLWIPLYRQ